MPSPIPDRPAPAACGACFNARKNHRARPFAPALACLLLVPALLLGACAPRGAAIADTYCRDTFYWRTAAGDTGETRRQADRHNSRRLCRCDGDCE